MKLNPALDEDRPKASQLARRRKELKARMSRQSINGPFDIRIDGKNRAAIQHADFRLLNLHGKSLLVTRKDEDLLGAKVGRDHGLLDVRRRSQHAYCPTYSSLGRLPDLVEISRHPSQPQMLPLSLEKLEEHQEAEMQE